MHGRGTHEHRKEADVPTRPGAGRDGRHRRARVRHHLQPGGQLHRHRNLSRNAHGNNGTVITCQSSDIAGTVTSAGAVTVNTLTFGNCTEPNLGVSCTVTVTTLPANLQINFASPRSTWTAAAVNEAATITCALGTVVCEASIDGTLGGTISNTGPGTITVEGTDNVIIGPGSIVCGQTATWSQSWTIGANYTITA
jgi:hypothetical protein